MIILALSECLPTLMGAKIGEFSEVESSGGQYVKQVGGIQEYVLLEHVLSGRGKGGLSSVCVGFCFSVLMRGHWKDAQGLHCTTKTYISCIKIITLG